MSDEIKIGDVVSVKIDRDCFEYKILDSKIIDIGKKEISCQSPVGKSLIGRKEGDTVQIFLPSDKFIKCEILKIKNNTRLQRRSM